ncbi:MAG: response regulator [Polyangiaceae bacterium]|nr:response regulator [Polyangiaceae bacterium]
MLIADDSLTVRMDLAEAFERAGFRPLLASTLSDARALLETEAVSLAILDVLFPDGDGVNLLRDIRSIEATCGLPVILLSTEAEVAARIRGLHTGADDYVGKPYDRGYVVARARDLLRTRVARPEGRSTVLLVDDSMTYREVLRVALESAGYSVLLAGTGEEGLQLAAGHRPKAVLVDSQMPGIDGATVVRRMRLDAALRGIPCILLTASEDDGAELRALDAGADAFARKDADLEVVLARLAAVLRNATAAPAASSALVGARRVLVVDDSETYLQEISSMLRDDGYDVVLARSGDEALEMLAAQEVDCVLLDLVMPGLSGTETCRRIKASPVVRDIPLIMITSVEDRTSMIAGLASGADDYITKSSELDVLKARVRAQIRRKQFEDEHRRIREELLRSELEASEERAAREAAETKARHAEERAALAGELERKNKELEAFSYSVSHDLRAPLRSVDGFGQLLLDQYAGTMDERGLGYLRRMRAAATRMGELIDDLLDLSRVSSIELHRKTIDLSKIAEDVAAELKRKEPSREVAFDIASGLDAHADGRLMRIVFENLFGNAWKFTMKIPAARIELGADRSGEGRVYFVRDNGAGFDMAYAKRLFSPFQRLHRDADFPGTGIGLATVSRIVDRHGGRVWAEGVVNRGATVFFTLRPDEGTKGS